MRSRAISMDGVDLDVMYYMADSRFNFFINKNRAVALVLFFFLRDLNDLWSCHGKAAL